MTSTLHTNDNAQGEWDVYRTPRAWEDTRVIQTRYSAGNLGHSASEPVAPQQTSDRRAPEAGSLWRIDQAKYWTGSFITAMVAGLVAIIGVVLAQGVFSISLLSLAGTTLAGAAATYGLICFGSAIAATLVYFGMMHWAPRPSLYFGWLVGLLSVLSSLICFVGAASLEVAAIHAGLNLLVGMVIIGLTVAAGASSRRRSV